MKNAKGIPVQLLYNLVLPLIGLASLPVWLAAFAVRPKLAKGLGQRLGFLPKSLRETIQAAPRPRVWLHAASVGEIAAIAPVARQLHDRNPQWSLLVSTMTQSGQEQAKRQIPFAAATLLLPLDFYGAARRVLNVAEPQLVAIAETELWPNFARQVKRHGSQLALINGRMSERSFSRYRRLQPLIRRLLERFDLLAVQTEKDQERFQALGANPQRVKVIGNVKFDVPVETDLEPLRAELRLAPDRPVWVAGSTRPGEEAIVVEAFQQVLAAQPSALLILAVRHLERIKEIQRLLGERRLAYALRSRVAKELLDFPVILVDTMGELAKFYGLANVAFVGGSLMPFGGHNPLEPAAWGVPVLVGPHTEHFSQAVAALTAAGGAQVVTQASDLAQAVIRLLADSREAKRRGGKARDVVAASQGGAVETVEMLQKLMLIKQWAGEVRRWRQESLAQAPRPAAVEKLPEDWPEW
ncbi:MAG: 3-deoxy-D-manno-octulosonic acid transferase [candidate division FCPU426 bacterium]